MYLSLSLSLSSALPTWRPLERARACDPPTEIFTNFIPKSIWKGIFCSKPRRPFQAQEYTLPLLHRATTWPSLMATMFMISAWSQNTGPICMLLARTKPKHERYLFTCIGVYTYEKSYQQLSYPLPQRL